MKYYAVPYESTPRSTVIMILREGLNPLYIHSIDLRAAVSYLKIMAEKENIEIEFVEKDWFEHPGVHRLIIDYEQRNEGIEFRPRRHTGSSVHGDSQRRTQSPGANFGASGFDSFKKWRGSNNQTEV